MNDPQTCYRRGVRACALGIFGLLTAGITWASPPSSEGARTFYIFPQVTQCDASTGQFSILVSMRGIDYPPHAIAVGRIMLGPGMTLIAGDTLHVAHPSLAWNGPEDYRWSLTLRAQRGRAVELRAAMRAEVGDGRIDEMESQMQVHLDADGIHATVPRTVREETVRAGQRYRYGGKFLVPIDGPEFVTASDIKVHALPIKEVAATCPTCPADGSKVAFVAFVDPSGNVRSSRALQNRKPGEHLSPDMLAAAAKALSRWTFSPARAGTGPVADWAIVEVEFAR